MSSVHYAIDLSPARLRPTRWSLALLGLGVAAACWAGYAMRRDSLAHDEDTQTLARLEGALAQRGAATRAEVLRPLSPAERRLQADLARVASDLYRPWLALLDALEASAVPKVNLQQLSVDSVFSKLQIQADAPDLPELLAYVHALDVAGAPFVSAQLLGHEWQAANGGPRRLQARISVALVAGVPSPRALP
jgi:hypothetical protein